MMINGDLSLQSYARNRWLVLDGQGVPVATINFIPIQDEHGFRSDIIGSDMDFTCYSSGDEEEDRTAALETLLAKFSAHYSNRSEMTWAVLRDEQGSVRRSGKIGSYG